MTKFPGREMPTSAIKDNINLKSYVVDDVLTSFNTISLFGQANHINLADTFEDAEETRYNIQIGNHFQGLTRHRNGKYFYYSGNDMEYGSHLFITKLETYIDKPEHKKYRKRAVRSNLISDKDRKKRDTIVDLFIIDEKFHHAGGISMMGDILVAPLEGGDKLGSKIVFINIIKPAKPSLIKLCIKSTGKAGCATAIKLSNGHILCASWTESGGRRFSLYLSKKPGLREFGKPLEVGIKEINNVIVKNALRFQAIQFVQDTNGKLFLVGLDSEKKTGGKSRWHLMRFHLHPDTISAKPKLKPPKVTMIVSKWPHRGYSYYHFNSCGGVYADDQKRLAIYGGSSSRGGRNGKTLKLSEFYPKLTTKDGPCADINDAVIELFTEPLFGGRSFVLQVRQANSVKNFQKVEVAGPTINDKIRSLSFMLPKGVTYCLYEDKNFNIGKRGKIKKSKKLLPLKGTGKVEYIPDLAAHPIATNIKISSSKLIKKYKRPNKG